MINPLQRTRQLLEVLARLAPRRRTAVDKSGDAAGLLALLDDAATQVPGAAALLTPDGRAEIEALDPDVSRTLSLWLEGPLEAEARARSACATDRSQGDGIPVDSVAGLMRRYRAGPARAQAAVERALDPAPWADGLSAAAEGWLDLRDVGRPPPEPPPEPELGPGGLVLPTAEMMAGLGIQPSTPPPPTKVTPAKAETAAPSPGLLELTQALAESVLGRRPQSSADWRRALGAAEVADFQSRPWRGRPARFETLPFEQPGVPLARPGAGTPSDQDAWASSAHLLGLAVATGGRPEIGACLALTACTRVFARRVLADAPDPDRAARAMALGIAVRMVQARLGGKAGGNGRTLAKLWVSAFGSPPLPALVHAHAAEIGLAGAAGETDALYVFTGAPFVAVLLKGCALARQVRDRFDEDWFDNPRADPHVLTEMSTALPPVEEAELAEWVQSSAGL